MAGWLEARTKSFTVYSRGPEHELRRVAAELEDYDSVLRTLTQTSSPPANPLSVYLVGSTAELAAVGGSRGILGFYAARVGGTAAFVLRKEHTVLSDDEVMRHEYAHHFMWQHSATYYPTWYVEGFAEYLMTTKVAGESVEVGRVHPGRAAELLRGTWIPLHELIAGQTGNDRRRSQFYAQSWLLVHYLFSSSERTAALSRYLNEIRKGSPETVAFRSAFGMDHATFEVELKRYMKGRLNYGILPAEGRNASEPVLVRALPSSADALLLPRAALMLGVADKARKTELVQAIRKSAAQFPEDRFARKVLARAEIDSGDRTTGVAFVEELLLAEPHDAELLYLRGLADFYIGRVDAEARSARYAQAHAWFARAIEADQKFYSARYRYAQTFDGRQPGASPTQGALEAFLSAYDLAPYVPDISIDTAKVLITAGHYAEAETILSPIAADPHGQGTSNLARDMLAAARFAANRAAAADPAPPK